MDTQIPWVVFVSTLIFMGQMTDGLVLQRNCVEELSGCGITIGNGVDNFECTCLENLDAPIFFDLFLFCALQETPPECCPCQFTSFMGANSPSRELNCADKTDIRRLKKLVKNATKTGQKIAKRCPNGIVDHTCCPTRLLKKVERLNAKIKVMSAKIAGDCGREPPV